ncbi:C6 transcription factor [Colletotrichum kahawae]|uniref:C6 transcription factor n=1 Tax=Colletotrichum kahawae TaxID=34407 RepID=A0AAD9Y8J2_COLKA|nr:C6 transcription factor [Colletotrichum kahawae]
MEKGHFRKYPGKSRLVQHAANTRYNEAVLQDIESIHATLKEIAKKVGASEPAALQSTTLRNSTDSPSQNGRPASTTNGNGYRLGVSGQDNHGPSCDNSPKISPEDENLPHVPIHSLYALTKLRALRSPDAPEGHSSPALDDFIARGALRLDDAERLFRLYRDRLDPFMYGVGCKYQQLSRARARPRSPALPEQLPRSGSAGSTILPWHTA